MFDELVTAYGNRFLVAALGVSLALLCLFIVLWLLRNRAPSPFVRGGRNRQPRLQVLDAAAVDARRRLVLVRRDNVEHLVMIGGPTDIVIESGIGDERGYLAATAVSDSAMQVTADLADQRLPQTAAAPRALERTETPPAAAALSVDSLLAGRPEAPPAVHRPHTTSSAAPAAAPAPAQAAMPQPAPATAPVKTAAPVIPTPSSAPAAAQPQAAPTIPTSPAAPAATPPAPAADLRKVEAPRIEPAAPIAPKVEAAAAVREAAPAVRSESPKVEVFAEKPQQAAPAASAATPTPPVAAPARPAAPAVQVPTAAAEPATTTAPVVPAPVRETRASEIPVAPAAFAATAAPFSAPAVEPAARPAAQQRPANPEGDAADILEAARQRVLTPAALLRDEPRFEPAAPEFQRRSTEQSEFEKVLEQEMALHLAAANDPLPKVTTPFASILPDTRPDRPVVPPIATPVRADTARPATPAPEEPDLQNEIARIFGEMSADRH